MAPKYALKTKYFVAVLGVFDEDRCAREGLDFGAFISALMEIGFVPSGQRKEGEVSFRWGVGCTGDTLALLRIPVPTVPTLWQPSEYRAVAEAMSQTFDIHGSDFIEVGNDVNMTSIGFLIPHWE
ncbi:hypothetical protein ONZ51_g11084 [Trametes cubensis]|uniref:Uncharacterized protein n=1 Tax=Trametes cubensis TaxID=1111947 RepID=A0AAD7X637_9APHY|nr:hypothetical protein ONZ51_g11084 [Trametes cubensis]